MSTLSVLIVEDELITALDLEETLQRMGYRVVGIADTGDLAIEMANQNRPEIVLMDITIRGAMDGITVAGLLRERFDLPIVYLTAHADPETLHRAARSGPFGYLIKPFEEHDLQMALTLASAKHSIERELRQAHARLNATVATLERRNGELQVFHTLAADLQLAVTSAGACAAIVEAVRQFFPEDSGMLMLQRSADGQLESVFAWGPLIKSGSPFPANTCPALNGRQIVIDSLIPICARCARAEQPTNLEIACVPLTTAEQQVGVLVLGHQAVPHNPSDESVTLADRRRLASALADQASLGLTNVLLRDALREQAVRDPLTGLFNRRYLDEALPRERARARRDRTPIGLVLIDIDHFKKINDTYGHGAGDTVLRSIGALLRASVRTSDIACRYGGEEFLLVLPTATAEATHQRAELICATLKQVRLEYGGEALPPITVSAGITLLQPSDDGIDAALTRADNALYAAKAAGRDRIVLA